MTLKIQNNRAINLSVTLESAPLKNVKAPPSEGLNLFNRYKQSHLIISVILDEEFFARISQKP